MCIIKRTLLYLFAILFISAPAGASVPQGFDTANATGPVPYSYNGTAILNIYSNGGTNELNVFGEARGLLQNGAFGQFRMSAAATGGYSSFLRNDGAYTYLLLTDSGDFNGAWNTLRPFYVNDANGMVNMGQGLTMIGSTSIQLSNDSRSCTASIAGTIKFMNKLFYGCDGTSWTLLSPNNGAPPNSVASTKHCNAKTDSSGNIQLTKSGDQNYVYSHIWWYTADIYDSTDLEGIICMADSAGLSETWYVQTAAEPQAFSPWQSP